MKAKLEYLPTAVILRILRKKMHPSIDSSTELLENIKKKEVNRLMFNQLAFETIQTKFPEDV